MFKIIRNFFVGVVSFIFKLLLFWWELLLVEFNVILFCFLNNVIIFGGVFVIVINYKG